MTKLLSLPVSLPQRIALVLWLASFSVAAQDRPVPRTGAGPAPGAAQLEKPTRRPSAADSLVATSEPTFPPELESLIGLALRDGQVPGAAVAIVKDERVITKGFGVRRLGHEEKVNGETVFDAASLMKSFTAAAVGSLVDERKLDWDDPVTRHLPWLEFSDPYLTANVTIRDLLSHRVGLRPSNGLFRLTGVDTRELLQRVRYIAPQVPFRSDMTYSNILYTAAGEAAAAACGCSFRELVTSRLLRPLGLERTSVGDDPNTKVNSATGHALLGGKLTPLRWRGMDDDTQPAGGLNSSAADLGKWLLFHMGDGTWQGKRIMSAAVFEQLHSPQTIISTTPAMRRARNVEFFAAYGLGWNIMDYRGHLMLWHSGNGDGTPVYMAYLPNEKLGVVVLLNSWSAPTLHGALANRVFDHYLNVRDGGAVSIQPAGPPVRPGPSEKGTKPSVPLDRYAGVYENPLYGPLTVILDGGRLFWTVYKGQRAELVHWQGDTFDVRWDDPVFRDYFPTTVTFTLDERGQPSRLRSTFLRDEFEARRR